MIRASADTPMKDRILAAALEVFASKGYHGAVVDDIVEVSRSSKGAFYHYFPSKQSVFLTLMDELASVVESGVRQPSRRSKARSRRLRRHCVLSLKLLLRKEISPGFS